MKKILTGIKPTGMPHIGNYLGAIRPAIELSRSENDCFYFIADYHSLTSIKDPKLFKQYVYEGIATWIALGLDTDKATFYRQSDLPEVFELNWILACHTPKGDLNRAHAYKAMVQDNQEAGKDPDLGVNTGLYTYPVLMAADILLFDTNVVPVGKDQIQHVEMARSMAQRFNQLFGETLVEPQEQIQKEVAIVPGLDGRKMSKSYNNTIGLFLPEKKLRKLVNKITTDSTPPEAPKDPNDSAIFDLYRQFGSETEIQALEKRYKEGISWGEAKAELFEVMNRELAPARERFNQLMENTDELERVMAKGAEKARAVAHQTMTRVRKACTGF